MFALNFRVGHELDQNIYGLGYNCPTLQRQEDCPFKEIDHLLFKEKVAWIVGLSKEEKRTILEHHKACSGNRL
jgi:hypothetical protein